VDEELGFAHADAASSLRADLKIAELGDHLYGTYVDYTSVRPTMHAPTVTTQLLGNCSEDIDDEGYQSFAATHDRRVFGVLRLFAFLEVLALLLNA